MITYSKFAPSRFDSKGLGLEDRQDWMVVEVFKNRDSSVLEECNFDKAWECISKIPGSDREDDDAEKHRFGHWANGWFELILVRPGSKAELEAQEIEAALSDYPILDEGGYDEKVRETANVMWANERTKDRIEYLRDNASEHEFDCFKDMLACVRGKFFAGDAMGYVERC